MKMQDPVKRLLEFCSVTKCSMSHVQVRKDLDEADEQIGLRAHKFPPVVRADLSGRDCRMDGDSSGEHKVTVSDGSEPERMNHVLRK